MDVDHYFQLTNYHGSGWGQKQKTLLAVVYRRTINGASKETAIGNNSRLPGMKAATRNHPRPHAPLIPDKRIARDSSTWERGARAIIILGHKK